MFGALPHRIREHPVDMVGLVIGEWSYNIGPTGKLFRRKFGLSTIWQEVEGGTSTFDEMIDIELNRALANLTLVGPAAGDELRNVVYGS